MTPFARTVGVMKEWHIAFRSKGLQSIARDKRRFEKTNPVCRKSQSGRTLFRVSRGLKSDLKNEPSVSQVSL